MPGTKFRTQLIIILFFFTGPCFYQCQLFKDASGSTEYKATNLQPQALIYHPRLVFWQDNVTFVLVFNVNIIIPVIQLASICS